MLKDVLKKLRKGAELSQIGLAERAGVSQQLIQRIESGDVSESRKLPKIAAALGTTAEEMLKGTAEANPPPPPPGPVKHSIHGHMLTDAAAGVGEEWGKIDDEPIRKAIAHLIDMVVAKEKREKRPTKSAAKPKRKGKREPRVYLTQ